MRIWLHKIKKSASWWCCLRKILTCAWAHFIMTTQCLTLIRSRVSRLIKWRRGEELSSSFHVKELKPWHWKTDMDVSRVLFSLFSRSLSQLFFIKLTNFSTQLNWKRPERQNCRRSILRNSMWFHFLQSTLGLIISLEVQSMTTLVYQMLTYSIIWDIF